MTSFPGYKNLIFVGNHKFNIYIYILMAKASKQPAKKVAPVAKKVAPVAKKAAPKKTAVKKAAVMLAPPLPAAPAVTPGTWQKSGRGGMWLSGLVTPSIVPLGSLIPGGFNEDTTGVAFPSFGVIGNSLLGGTWSNDNPALANYISFGTVGLYDQYEVSSIVGRTGTVHITYSKPGYTPVTILFTII
jgi:hypothetical protein